MNLLRPGPCRIGAVSLSLWILAAAPACSSAPPERAADDVTPREAAPADADALHADERHAMAAHAAAPALAAAAPGEALTVCSFNVQFVGQSSRRDNAALAQLVSGFDIVLVQEILAPPFDGQFPSGDPYRIDDESRAFLEAMLDAGFDAWYSEQDTGPGETNDNNGTATEWFAVFFKPDEVETPDDLPWGFLADDVTAHPDYDRVPYAFCFRTPGGELDFVLVSVHLHPDDTNAGALRRRHELAAIADWIDDNDDQERDFIIVGDMNIQDEDELATATPPGFLSLNDECRPTNTNVNGPKPYDHAMYRPLHTPEVDESFDLEVVDLIEAFRDAWAGTDPYPGGPPYDHNEFRAIYSDHHPVVFRFIVPDADDD